MSSVILRGIRRRRHETAQQTPVPTSTIPAKLREASFADFDGVMALRKGFGWNNDSLENWNRLWCQNPALLQMKAAPPIGWVLEAEGKIVGYLGNIPLICHYGGRMLTAVTGSGFVVDPAYRTFCMSLVAAQHRQKNVDLFLATTAVESVGKIVRALKWDPLPQPEYDTALFWVLQPDQFAKAVMCKLGVPSSLSNVASGVAGTAVRIDRAIHQRVATKRSGHSELIELAVNEIGGDFHQLWLEKLAERPRLLADRSPATLRWHFSIPADRGSARVFCCYKGKKLLGYAVIRNESADLETGLRKSIIADMLVQNDEPDILKSLWAACYQHAKNAGSHIFEVLGFPPGIRQLSSGWRPYQRKYPSLPYLYRAADPTLHNALADGSAWYACPFDGDATLWSSGSA